jgi:hypothetical protein
LRHENNNHFGMFLFVYLKKLKKSFDEMFSSVD